MELAYFNTLDYVKLLVQADFSQKQAEALNKAQIMATKAVITQVATPADIQNLRIATQADLEKTGASIRIDLSKEIQGVRTELKQEIQNVRSELKQDIQDLRAELKQDIQDLRAELKQDIQNLRTELKQDIQDLRTEIHVLRTDMLISEARVKDAIFRAVSYMVGINIALITIGLAVLDFFILK